MPQKNNEFLEIKNYLEDVGRHCGENEEAREEISHDMSDKGCLPKI